MTHNKEKNKSIETDAEMTVNRKYLITIICSREEGKIEHIRDIENT